MNDINDSGIAIEKYELHLEIDHTKSSFNGACTYSFSKPIEQQDFIRLFIDDLVVVDYTINQQKYKDVQYNKENHTTTLKLHSHQSVSEISINYIGKISQISTFRDKTYGIFKTNVMNDSGKSNNIVISTHCQPNFAAKIFPCLLNGKSKFELTIKTNDRFKIVSNTGIASYVTHEKYHTRSVTFKETPYMQPAVFGFTIGDLEQIETTIKTPTVEKFPITVYSPVSIKDCSFALDIISKYFAVLNNEVFTENPYQMDKLDFVALPFLSDLAMENHGMISIQMNHILLPQVVKNSSQYQQMEQLLVHELVHLWMGNYISFNWKSLWFNEAFATYMANHLIENAFQTDDYLQHYYLPCLDVASNFSKTIDESLPKDVHFTCTTDQLFNPQSYVRGIPMIRSLVEQCGFDNFVKSLSGFFQKPQNIIDPVEIFEALRIDETYLNYLSEFHETPLIVISEGQEISGITPKDKFPVFFENGSSVTADKLLSEKELILENHYLFNSNALGLYRVKYENTEVITKIVEKLDTLKEFDLYSILKDEQYFISSTKVQLTKYDLQLPIEILSKIVASPDKFIKLRKNDHTYNRAICMILEILQKLQISFVKYGSGKDEFESILGENIYAKCLKPLFVIFQKHFLNSEKMEFELENASDLEWSILSHLIFLLKDDETVFTLGSDVIKSILSGRPIKSKIPLELIGSCMAAYSSRVDSEKEWKKIFNMVKNFEPYMSHVDYSVSDYADVATAALAVQQSIIENIGFTTSKKLVLKMLNHIHLNMENRGVEFLLSGVVFNHNRAAQLEQTTAGDEIAIKDLVWQWYENNFDTMAQTALKNGSEASLKVLETLQNMTNLVFSMFLMQDSEKIEQFILLNQSKFNKNLKLDKIWPAVKEAEASNIVLYQLLLQLKYDL